MRSCSSRLSLLVASLIIGLAFVHPSPAGVLDHGDHQGEDHSFEDHKNEDLDGIIAMLVDGQIVGIEIPQAVVLEIIDTAPGIKGASATSRTKPATLSTGLEVQVPEYLEAGERIKVNTTNAKFISRG